MPLAMPQPDFEPSLRLHPSAFSAQAEVEPDRFGGPGEEDEDADPVDRHPKHHANQLFMVCCDRR
jgi:hypothetical protein